MRPGSPIIPKTTRNPELWNSDPESRLLPKHPDHLCKRAHLAANITDADTGVEDTQVSVGGIRNRRWRRKSVSSTRKAVSPCFGVPNHGETMKLERPAFLKFCFEGSDPSFRSLGSILPESRIYLSAVSDPTGFLSGSVGLVFPNSPILPGSSNNAASAALRKKYKRWRCISSCGSAPELYCGIVRPRCSPSASTRFEVARKKNPFHPNPTQKTASP